MVDGTQAAGLALIAQEIASSRKTTLPGGQMVQVFGGRMEGSTATGASGTTYELVMEMPGLATGVNDAQIITGQGNGASPNPGIFASFLPISDLSDLNASNYAGAYAASWGGNSAIQIPPSGVNSAREEQICDPIIFTPVARTTMGAVRPLVSARVFVGGGNNVNMFNNGVQDFANWATRAAGIVRMRYNTNAGDQRTNPAGWANTLVSPVIGFALSSIIPIIQGAFIGDSIEEGQGTYIGASYGLLATEYLNTLGGKAQFSYANMAWSGSSLQSFANNFDAMTLQGWSPNWAFLPGWSPNQPTGGTITSADIQTCENYLTHMLSRAYKYNITPIIGNGMPTNSSVHNWGASDSLRVNWANYLLTLRNYGLQVLDTNSVMSGLTVGGQVQMVAGYTNDGIHPNDAGNNALYPGLAAILQNIYMGFI